MKFKKIPDKVLVEDARSSKRYELRHGLDTLENILLIKPLRKKADARFARLRPEDSIQLQDLLDPIEDMLDGTREIIREDLRARAEYARLEAWFSDSL